MDIKKEVEAIMRLLEFIANDHISVKPNKCFDLVGAYQIAISKRINENECTLRKR